jgi:hypothetical protein
MRVVSNSVRLSATDLSNHLACAHLTTLDRAVALGDLPAPRCWDPKSAVLRERRFAHERAFLDHLRKESLEVIEVDEALDVERAFARTQELIQNGAQVIARQATLRDGDWQGRADVLRRVERPSGLGSGRHNRTLLRFSDSGRAGNIGEWADTGKYGAVQRDEAYAAVPPVPRGSAA